MMKIMRMDMCATFSENLVDLNGYYVDQYEAQQTWVNEPIRTVSLGMFTRGTGCDPQPLISCMSHTMSGCNEVRSYIPTTLDVIGCIP